MAIVMAAEKQIARWNMVDHVLRSALPVAEAKKSSAMTAAVPDGKSRNKVSMKIYRVLNSLDLA